MTGPQAGVLVWPSGANWLLLSTTDGFRHVADRTPPAVDTGGGLAIAVDGARVAAAIGAVERLVRSPLVTANRSWRWQPGEIPGAVAAARHSVALGATTTYVVLRDGRVTALEHGRLDDPDERRAVGPRFPTATPCRRRGRTTWS